MSNQSLKKLGSDLKFVYSDNNSISVIFQNNDLLMGVVGEFNSNLKELEKFSELKRIRYTTSHPLDMTDDLIECYSKSKKLVPFIHLPVQSLSLIHI